jgi:hypothetical protein
VSAGWGLKLGRGGEKRPALLRRDYTHSHPESGVGAGEGMWCVRFPGGEREQQYVRRERVRSGVSRREDGREREERSWCGCVDGLMVCA